MILPARGRSGHLAALGLQTATRNASAGIAKLQPMSVALNELSVIHSIIALPLSYSVSLILALVASN
ncbi:MAG: hypothetical protein WC227_04125 [Patescibacteria group bacterium]